MNRGGWKLLLSTSLVVAGLAGCSHKPSTELSGQGDPRLDGKYVLVGTELGGVFSKETDSRQEYVFTGDKMLVQKGKKEEAETITCDPTRTPAQITIINKQTDGNLETVYGIYKLEGNELTLCLRKTNNPEERPTIFKTTPDSHAIMMVLRREP